MEKAKLLFIVTLVFLLGLFILTPHVWCQKITLTHDDITRAKAVFDDPKPLFKELPLSKVLPPDSYRKLTHDVEAMKSAWADVLGFKTLMWWARFSRRLNRAHIPIKIEINTLDLKN